MAPPQRPMRPRRVVVVDVLAEHSAEVLLAQGNDVVDAFTSQRPDQSLSNRVGLRCVHRRQHGLDPDSFPAGDEVTAVCTVTVTDQKAGTSVPGCGVPLSDPHRVCDVSQYVELAATRSDGVFVAYTSKPLALGSG